MVVVLESESTELDRIFELAALLEPDWPAIMARIPSWHPRNESGGAPPAGGGTPPGGEGGGTGSGSEDDDDDDDDDDDKEDKDRQADWKARSRRSERALRKERKEREELQKQLKDREELDKSTHEKAIEAAREEGEQKAREAADKERRADRLETATVRLASKGFTVKDADGNEKTLRFADAEDAHTYIERAIRRGDLDEDDFFDDKGKVQNDALTEALQELIESKPHLVANGGGSGGTTKVKGSADGGKGSGGGKGVEDLSVAEHLARIQKR